MYFNFDFIWTGSFPVSLSLDFMNYFYTLIISGFSILLSMGNKSSIIVKNIFLFSVVLRKSNVFVETFVMFVLKRSMFH